MRQKEKTSTLGPEGTFSEEAASLLSKKRATVNSLLLCDGEDDVISDVKQGAASYGVLAIYSKRKGLIQENLDRIYWAGVNLCDSMRVPVQFWLGKAQGSKSQSAVYSHPAALHQVRQWLNKYDPHLEQVALGASTAAGAEKVSETGEGLAVASKRALDLHELEPICRIPIGKTYTDFLLFSADEEHEYEAGHVHYTMVAVNPPGDRPMLLHDITRELGKYGLNLARVHNRPDEDPSQEGAGWTLEDLTGDNGEVEPQIFTFEIVGRADSDEVKWSLDALSRLLDPRQQHDDIVRVMGSYPKPTLRKYMERLSDDELEAYS